MRDYVMMRQLASPSSPRVSQGVAVSALRTSGFSLLTIDRDRAFIKELGHLDHRLNAVGGQC
jgi:hypothetical protein